MYQPAHFREDRLEVQHALIRAHPLGLLVSAGEGGLVADHVPFLLDGSASSLGTLRCHVARANPHWQRLASTTEVLIVFQGPQAYITPSWYPSKHEHGKVVPTWNYVTVHAWGHPQVMDDPAWLRRQIDSLTRQQEATRAAPWHVDDAPASFIDAQIKAVVGIEIAITRIEGKWKVSQNRPQADRAGVTAGLSQGNDHARAVGALVTERAKSSEVNS